MASEALSEAFIVASLPHVLNRNRCLKEIKKIAYEPATLKTWWHSIVNVFHNTSYHVGVVHSYTAASLLNSISTFSIIGKGNNPKSNHSPSLLLGFLSMTLCSKGSNIAYQIVEPDMSCWHDISDAKILHTLQITYVRGLHMLNLREFVSLSLMLTESDLVDKFVSCRHDLNRFPALERECTG